MRKSLASRTTLVESEFSLLRMEIELLFRCSRDELVEGGDENWDLRLPVVGSLRAFLRVK